MLATWFLWWVSCRFYLPKVHLDFELLFLPKMCKINSVRHMTQPHQRFKKYFTCQVFNRITECDCVWRIPWWIIRVTEFLVEIHLFSYRHQVNWVQPQLCLIWNLILSKSTKPTPMILCLKFYLEQDEMWKKVIDYCEN